MGFIHMVAVSQDRREPQEIMGNRHDARGLGISLTNRPVGDCIAHPMPTSDPLITALDNRAKSNKDSAQAIADSLKDVASAAIS
jgi:hypothetical protein